MLLTRHTLDAEGHRIEFARDIYRRCASFWLDTDLPPRPRPSDRVEGPRLDPLRSLGASSHDHADPGLADVFHEGAGALV